MTTDRAPHTGAATVGELPPRGAMLRLPAPRRVRTAWEVAEMAIGAMEFTSNEVRTLVDLLETVAAGAVTPNQAATAGGLAARFRARQAPATTPLGDAPRTDFPAGGKIQSEGAPAATTRLDHVAILAKRRAVEEEAMAAQARLQERRE